MNNFLKDSNGFVEFAARNKSFELNDLLTIIAPHSDDYEDIFVPQRFSETVSCHIIAPYLDDLTYYKPPMYLAIRGKAGEGKTTQTIATCVQKGFCVIYVSAASLSGSHENDAKEKLREVYYQALKIRRESLVSIIIDDFHKGIVNEDENIKKTINSNVLTGYMMNIAEQNGNTQIPIVLTANDLSQIYAPLLRSGRADIFTWDPSFEEKTEILYNILCSILKDKNKNKFKQFCKQFSNENIAFFVQLKNQWRKQQLKRVLKNISEFNASSIKHINNEVSLASSEISFSDLINIAQSSIAERKMPND